MTNTNYPYCPNCRRDMSAEEICYICREQTRKLRKSALIATIELAKALEDTSLDPRYVRFAMHDAMRTIKRALDG